MKTFHLWLGVLLCSTIACKKEKKETTVNGRVITYGTDTKATGQPLNVGLYRTTASGTGFGTGEALLQETITDTNGNYRFIFKPVEESSRYFLRLITQSVSNHYESSGQVQLDVGINQTKNIMLSPHAWVKLHLINNGPYFPGDKIRFQIGRSGILELYGPVNNQGIYGVAGNAKCIVSYTVFRNNDASSFKDTISYVPAFDTIYHLIEY